MKKSKLTARSTNKARSLPPSPANACGSLVSASTKANGAKNGVASDAQAPTAGTVARFFLSLAEQKTPSAEDLNSLRKMIVSTPESWHRVIGQTDSIRDGIIDKLYSHGVMRAVVLAEMDILKQQMGYDHAPVLERMHIDHVLTSWLRLRDAEIQFTHCCGLDGVGETVKFRQDLLESAQARFLRAGESLEKLRRLARNTPAFQINIANDGGKQVNIQNDACQTKGSPGK